MSVFTCCAGGKRHRRTTSASKHPPPIDRYSHISDQSALPTVPSCSSVEKLQPQSILTSFLLVQEKCAEADSNLTQQLDIETLPISVNEQSCSNGDISNIHVELEKSSGCDATQESLDQILAHLLSDISSPSFQRTNNINSSKIDENINKHNIFFPDSSMINGHDVNMTSLVVQISDSECDTLGDYDIPCGVSDKICSDVIQQDQDDYDVPPSPVSCNDNFKSSAVDTPSIVLRQNHLKDVDTNNVEINAVDYDIPRALNDNDCSHMSYSVDDVILQPMDDVKQTNDNAFLSTYSPASDNECRLNLNDQFKAVRIKILASLSQVLKCVGSTEDTMQTKFTNVSQLCSTLKTNLNRFVCFIQLLLIKLQTDDNSIQTQVYSLYEVQSAIDQYQQEMTTHSNSEISAKLVNIIHITKGIPGLLRTFAPLVECAALTMDQSESTLPNVSRVECSTVDDETEQQVREQPECEVTDRVVEVISDSDLLHTNRHVPPTDDMQPPCLPPKQKLQTSAVDVNHNVTQSIAFISDNQDESTVSPCECDRLQSVSQTNLNNETNYEPAVMRRKPAIDVIQRISQSELQTPDVRASGISQTMADELEELRKQADSQYVRLHTADFNKVPVSVACSDTMYQLSDNDRRLLMFYCCQTTNNWNVLDNAAAAFFHCMQRKQFPKVFVMHSKFVILAGHKMAYIGDILAKNIEDDGARDYIIEYSNRLCDSLKMAVRTTKEAALKFPDIPEQQLMVDCIKEVTDWAIELKEVIDRLTYIGRPDYLLA